LTLKVCLDSMLKPKLHDKYLVFDKLSRYFIVTGGRGSGKSFGIALILLLLTFEKGHSILFTRFTLKSAGLSIIPEFLEKIDLLGLQEKFRVTKDEIVNLETGSAILFRGIKTSSGDQTANLKSLQGITTFVLDEGEELVEEEIFDKIDLSVRVKGMDNRVIVLMNPATKEHFICKKFFERVGVQEGLNQTIGDTTYIHTTYLDNIENLSNSFLKTVQEMKERRPSKYKHQIEGGWLSKEEGVIFDNWTIGEFKEVAPSVYGQDYGFSADPTTLVRTSIDRDNKIIYLKEELYAQGLTTSEIYKINNKVAGDSLIIGDSAEPRLISELEELGLNIEGAIKGADSVKYGIALLLDYDLVVEEESLNLIKELNNYVWLKNKEVPCDSFNHILDGVRYSISYQLQNESKGEYYIY